MQVILSLMEHFKKENDQAQAKGIMLMAKLLNTKENGKMTKKMAKVNHLLNLSN